MDKWRVMQLHTEEDILYTKEEIRKRERCAENSALAWEFILMSFILGFAVASATIAFSMIGVA